MPRSDTSTSYFIWDGQPARKRGKYGLVEVYVGGGDWQVHDEPDFVTASAATAEQIHEAIDQWDQRLRQATSSR